MKAALSVLPPPQAGEGAHRRRSNAICDNPVVREAVLVTFNHGIAGAAEGFLNHRRGGLSPQAREPIA